MVYAALAVIAPRTRSHRGIVLVASRPAGIAGNHSPRSYAFADKVRLRVPLVLFNTGAKALIVSERRLVIVDEPARAALGWITTRFQLRPESDGHRYSSRPRFIRRISGPIWSFSTGGHRHPLTTTGPYETAGKGRERQPAEPKLRSSGVLAGGTVRSLRLVAHAENSRRTSPVHHEDAAWRPSTGHWIYADRMVKPIMLPDEPWGEESGLEAC